LRTTELAGDTGARLRPPPRGDPEICGLSADSRTIRPGFLFAALPGTRLDGRRFAVEAVARGAAAILTDDAAALNLPAEAAERVAILTADNPHRQFALLAARFYGRQPRIIAAVTGTNGKTSIVHFTREIWTRLGCAAASLGTLGLVREAGRRPGSLTTPDPVALHADLAALAADGIEHVAIEASSHGLAQFRLDGLDLAAAAFTNLSRDHLDYHGDMERYRTAKERLFTALLAPGKQAVLNTDSPEFARLSGLCRARGQRVLAYGAGAAAELRLLAATPEEDGQALTIEVFGERHDLRLPLVGRFQASNVLCALGLAIATGMPAAAASEALAGLSGVPGRMQRVARLTGGGTIVVDYAHTSDALATALAALRPHVRGKLVVLFGAGGDRDPGKRPLMGEAATRGADRVIVTDDNPRSEPPAAIRRAIMAAAPGAVEIGDRRQAIAAAIAELGPGDLLLLAGKGHETGQIVGNDELPFDDAVVAREVARDAGRLAE
jgi:UDP-N-acetylmuramoyl-L-alanyl-D-glutamate--2,6-diaminopimelate ligase